MTARRRLKLDRKKLMDAKAAVYKGRAKLKETSGDPFWGPILGDLAVALAVLERRLDELSGRTTDEEGGDE